MDVVQLIQKVLKRNGEVRVAEIVKITGFTRGYINHYFKDLRNEGRIVLIGKANRARYVSASLRTVQKIKKQELSYNRILKNINLSEDLILEDIQRKTGIFSHLRENASQIIRYAFTEILNNSIEHSQSSQINVKMKRNKESVIFNITDRGIGIFNNIMKKQALRSEMEALQELLKGKQTTAPKNHSGEGIFFTSKAVDLMIIQGSHKKLIFDNQMEDVFITDIKPVKGTVVQCRISCNTKRDLQTIFKQYTSESFKFNKTIVSVGLYKGDSDYLSRSQARRILSGLERFSTILLDFKKVKFVGQAFADEVFRVWQNRHPGIKIEVKNANENIQFMIRHVLGKSVS